MTARTAAAFFISLLALSASFVVAIIVTILVTREMELPEMETGRLEV
jgi:ABC-type proline/glycine betaine transport system permease subunit